MYMKKSMRKNNSNLKLSTCLFNVGLNLAISNDSLTNNLKSLLTNPNSLKFSKCPPCFELCRCCLPIVACGALYLRFYSVMCEIPRCSHILILICFLVSPMLVSLQVPHVYWYESKD